jgi:hypothetical protein
MKMSFWLPVAAGVLLAGCGDDTSKKPAQTTNAAANYNTGNPLTAVPDYIGAVGQAQKYSVKQIDLAYVNNAIQQFNAAEGHYPKDLDEMVAEHYLGKIPDAPFGYKIVYDATNGAIQVVKQ